MAGKNLLYMRQTALIVLMAQIGSFVPAASANIGIVDRIFTRVGASDDLASGQSTFYGGDDRGGQISSGNATSDSLLILDEIGRYSTFDGFPSPGQSSNISQTPHSGGKDTVRNPLSRTDRAGRQAAGGT